MTNKQKAIKCLKELKIFKPFIDEFKQSGTITMFEDFNGYFVKQGHDYYNLINKIEKDYNVKVYTSIHKIDLEHGELLIFLIVDNDKDTNRKYVSAYNESMNNFVCYAYIHNITYPDMDEMGNALVESFGGGIRFIK